MKSLNYIPTYEDSDSPSKFYETYRDLDLDTKLTLREFIQLFNEENENPFWNQFYLEHYRNGTSVDLDYDLTKITPRNYCVIS